MEIFALLWREWDSAQQPVGRGGRGEALAETFAKREFHVILFGKFKCSQD